MSSSAIDTVCVNGWKFIQVKLRRRAVELLAALLLACIKYAGRQRTCRRGDSSPAINAFTGMAGQLAVHQLMHHAGFKSQMSVIRPKPDDGFDFLVLPETRLEVKTGCLRDGRTVATLRHGDALRIPTSNFAADAFVWCILDPSFQDTVYDAIVVYIVAVVPSLILNTESPGNWQRWFPRFKQLGERVKQQNLKELKIRFGDIRYFNLHPDTLIDVLRPIALPYSGSAKSARFQSHATLSETILDIVQSYDLFSDADLARFQGDTLGHAGVMRLTEQLLEREPIFGGAKWSTGHPISLSDSPPAKKVHNQANSLLH